MENQMIKKRMYSVELIIDEYVGWKKDTKEFRKFMEKKYEHKAEEIKSDKPKDGARQRVSNK